MFDDDEAYEAYDDFEWSGGYEDDIYEAADYDDEEPDFEVDEAADNVDEAYINYLESRRRMRELALSRGFFSVVALPPDDVKGWNKGGAGGGSTSKGKGKGKSREKALEVASVALLTIDDRWLDSDDLQPQLPVRRPRKAQSQL